MNVLFAAVEMSPLVKVGGLGDVTGSLPRALRACGIDVRVAMPLHGAIDRGELALTLVADDVEVPWHDGAQRAKVWRAEIRDVPVYLIENERYFAREKVYGYEDDDDRMLFFCDALLACASSLDFQPAAIHAHDWHAALLLARLAAAPEHPWALSGRVYTIHNLAQQGELTELFLARAGFAEAQLRAPDGLPDEIALNGMAQGIIHADLVNTVSETYAKEILTPEYGAGLDSLLRARSDVLSGIVNGIDYDEFNPATDGAIARHYSAETVDSLDGRAEDKRALQVEAGLPDRAEAMLFGAVTRLFAQKGIDLAAVAFDTLLAQRDVQLVVLGTGDEKVHDMLLRLQAKYPARAKIWLDFNPELGQRIYAGCDSFLMPSRFEPCGLGQMIALRYGAVPLVRRTGGLADTVQNADLPLRSGNGFVFDAANARELEHAVERALAAFENRDGWRALQLRGMRQDWSWRRAADRYIALYERAQKAARGRAHA